MHDELTTERLRARRIRDGDLPYIILVDTDPEIQKTVYRTLSTRAESEARLQRWLIEEREAQLGFWIFSLNGEDIGHGGLFRSSRVQGEVELGYALRPAFWGKGFATEMAHALIDVARKLALPRLIAMTYPGNLTSQRVLDKCDFSPDDDYVSPLGEASPRYLLNLIQL
jgi:ribosomal-protein-alanine N-acetyltransferase